MESPKPSPSSKPPLFPDSKGLEASKSLPPTLSPPKGSSRSPPCACERPDEERTGALPEELEDLEGAFPNGSCMELELSSSNGFSSAPKSPHSLSPDAEGAEAEAEDCCLEEEEDCRLTGSAAAPRFLNADGVSSSRPKELASSPPNSNSEAVSVPNSNSIADSGTGFFLGASTGAGVGLEGCLGASTGAAGALAGAACFLG